MIARERHDDAGAIAQHEQRIHKRAQKFVDLQNLIVQLFRVGPVAMANCIGGRQRNVEQVGAIWIGAQLHLLHSFQRKVERQLIHHGKVAQAGGGQRIIVVNNVREHEFLPLRLGGHAIKLCVRAIWQQWIPDPPAIPGRQFAIVERLHPRWQRFRVILAGREVALCGVPVHIALAFADWQNCRAILARN